MTPPPSAKQFFWRYRQFFYFFLIRLDKVRLFSLGGSYSARGYNPQKTILVNILHWIRYYTGLIAKTVMQMISFMNNLFTNVLLKFLNHRFRNFYKSISFQIENFETSITRLRFLFLSKRSKKFTYRRHLNPTTRRTSRTSSS